MLTLFDRQKGVARQTIVIVPTVAMKKHVVTKCMQTR